MQRAAAVGFRIRQCFGRRERQRTRSIFAAKQLRVGQHPGWCRRFGDRNGVAGSAGQPAHEWDATRHGPARHHAEQHRLWISLRHAVSNREERPSGQRYGIAGERRCAAPVAFLQVRGIPSICFTCRGGRTSVPFASLQPRSPKKRPGSNSNICFARPGTETKSAGADLPQTPAPLMQDHARGRLRPWFATLQQPQPFPSSRGTSSTQRRQSRSCA